MMSRIGRLMLSAAVVSLTAVGVQAQGVMTHHVRQAVKNGSAAAIGRLPSQQTMSLDLVLPLRDAAGLKSFLADVYNPKSAEYRRFLTPAEFTERFGPTVEQYEEVTRFATSHGLKVTGGSRDGMELQVKGPVSAVETAFHVNMRTYLHPTEGRTFYAPDREPTEDLSFPLWHVSGMDNYSIPHPMYKKRSEEAARRGIEPEAVTKHATTGSGPSASFLGSDMRAAYYSGSLTGAGQNLGLFEYEGTDLADLNTYYKNVGQTLPITPQLLSVDGTATTCVDTRAGGNCDDTEQTLDMTQALGMAPGLSSMVVYIGSTDTAIISQMTTHSPLPTTIGCSWGWTPADPSTLDPYFQKMAAQGQNFFAASGDSSTWSSSNEAWPADDAYVVSVGGTDLVTASAGGEWSSETAWANSGGGITPDKIAIPSWQSLSGVINSSNKGSTTLRNGPDVSANANYTFYTCSDQTTCLANEYGGTSFAAPMWAAYIALVNQQLVANGKATIGFINPTIYQQNVTASTYAADFHDITSGTSGSYSAVAGFDLVTGWGSPNAGLIAALTGSGTTSNPSFALSGTSASIVQGKTGTSTITSTVSGGFNSAISLAASGLPTGVTAAFSPTSIAGAGSSTLTFTVGSTAATGSYSVTVTGTSGSLSATTTVGLTITSSGGTSGTFTVSVSPSSGYLDQGQSGYAVVTTSVSGGFSSAITFSSSGAPSGVTTSFSPASIAAPGSGTTDFNITVSRSAKTGTYPLTITATGGGVTKTTTLSLQVRR